MNPVKGPCEYCLGKALLSDDLRFSFDLRIVHNMLVINYKDLDSGFGGRASKIIKACPICRRELDTP